MFGFSPDEEDPPLLPKTSRARRTVVTVQMIQENAANAASARAATQTVPRQNRSLERKTASAMKPAK